MSEKPKFNSDALMRKLFVSLVRDFRSTMGPAYKEDLVSLVQAGDIKTFRTMPFPDRLQSPKQETCELVKLMRLYEPCSAAPPSIFKMEAQLEGLFKRYRFEVDMYTDKELEKATFKKFIGLQERLASQDWKPLPLRTFTVVQTARKIIKEILDPFDPNAFSDICRFSTRATVGNPAHDAYLDHKLADPITGSPEHIKWFKSHLRSAGYLRDVLAQCSPSGEPSFLVCESLPLVGVPKSYKSLREIQPNTLIGSYRTYGIGQLFVKALKAAGLDIRKLQREHRRLARTNSKTRKLVTADMSAASESFLWSLICRLLPRKWLKVVNEGRLRYLVRKTGKRTKTYAYASFMAMGIGFTFPLQTLLFYALLKAVCLLLKFDGEDISVYGDDLIYPRGAHRYVFQVFQDLGMQMNADKTFVNSNFRESCGGDYYHGEDVRPFSPEGSYKELSARSYEAWLYQLVNGLALRWSPEYIPITNRMLKLEILRVTRAVKQVPPSFPDDSGWRVSSPDPFWNINGMMPVLVRFRNGTREYVFSHLRKTYQNRYVSFEEPYLWDWLRSKAAGDLSLDYSPPLDRDFRTWLRLERQRIRMKETDWFQPGTAELKLVPLPRQPKNYRSKTGKRLKRTIAVTTCKLTAPKIQTDVTDSISDWT